jgi:hypothetical protein
VCVCERERERKRERKKEREREMALFFNAHNEARLDSLLHTLKVY